MTKRKTKKAIIWPVDMEGAKKMQESLRLKALISSLTTRPKTIAGVDAAFFDDKVLAVATLYTYPDMALIEHSYAVAKLVFPYIPGYLSFREGPAVIKAIEGLKEVPDVIIFDGQGIAHPKGLGIATHIGILLDLPTIGCAKSRLVGIFQEPGLDKGCWSPLRYKEKIVGAVLRSKNKTKPLFVSPGHKVDLKSATDLVLGCATSYRLPEPVRMADKMTKEIKKEMLKQGVGGSCQGAE